MNTSRDIARIEAGTNIASIGGAAERSQISSRPAQAALIAFGVYLSYLTLSPFVVAFTWAGLFAILFRDAHVALARRIGSNRAALVLTLAVTVLIIAPAAILISAVTREAPRATNYVKESSETAPGIILSIWSGLRAKSPFPMPEDPTDVVTAAGERLRALAMAHAGAFVTGSLASLGTLGATLLALFFMLRESDALSRHIRDLLPFPRGESEQLMSETSLTVFGNLLRPMLLSGKTSMNGGVVFFGLLGGAAAFGLVGRIIGPIILVMTSRLIKTILRSDDRRGARDGEQSAAA